MSDLETERSKSRDIESNFLSAVSTLFPNFQNFKVGLETNAHKFYINLKASFLCLSFARQISKPSTDRLS